MNDMADFTPKPRKEEHLDYQRFDEVRIETVERWKESYHSGDEWRFGAVLRLYKNGYIVCERSFRDVATASAHLPATLNSDHCDNDLITRGFDEPICQQEGCRNVATHKRDLKKRYVGNQAMEDTQNETPLYRIFCDKHANRGDCAIDDAEHNYEDRVDQPYKLTLAQDLTQ